MGFLNKQQANELFHREAILIDGTDVLPLSAATRLFGQEAVSFARRNKNNTNGFGVGDFTLQFLYYRGYLDAVSYYNVLQVREERSGTT